MPQLCEPSVSLRVSFLEAMAEFRAEGRGGYDDDSMLGSEMRRFGQSWNDPFEFERFVAELRSQALEETPRPAHFVPCTTLWYAECATYIGRIAIRHRLTPHLLEEGGHIGYDVRPTLRRRGHATAMLRDALPLARQLGIDRVLVTCNVDNTPSRRVIEANGGVLEDARGGKLRFWID